MKFKFWDRSRDTYKSCETIYTAPVSGVYHIQTRIMRHRDTGRKKWIQNYDRMWFQFWKPKMVQVSEYEVIQDETTSAHRRFEAGEAVKIDSGMELK